MKEMVSALNALNAAPRLANVDTLETIEKYAKNDDVTYHLKVLLELNNADNLYTILENLEINYLIEIIAKELKFYANKDNIKAYIYNLEKLLKLYAKYNGEIRRIISENIINDTDVVDDEIVKKVYSILMFYFLQKILKICNEMESINDRLVLVNTIIKNIKILALIQ
ncbi:MAG: hypothetical protein QXV17_13435 [Candidatus Micrarchaeaceae archaeon]